VSNRAEGTHTHIHTRTRTHTERRCPVYNAGRQHRQLRTVITIALIIFLRSFCRKKTRSFVTIALPELSLIFSSTS